MLMTTLARPPVAKAGMLIRKPVREVFEAFVDPAVTTKFWFTASSGRLEAGARVRWEWDMYGASAEAVVLEFQGNERIILDWGDERSGYTKVSWTFAPRGDEETYVSIENEGFGGSGDEAVAQAIDSTEGFAIVLCGLKAYLEHGVLLNLIGDKFPDARVK